MNLDIFLCFKDIQYVIGRKTNPKYKACLLLSWVVWRIYMLSIQPLNNSERKLYFSLYGKTCNLSMCRAWIKFQVEPKCIFVTWALSKCLSPFFDCTQWTCLYNCSQTWSNKRVLLAHQESDVEGYINSGGDRHQLAWDFSQSRI